MGEDLNLRQRKKRQTRRALVEAALRLFTEQGYDDTTVLQITAAAEVSSKTFFAYFPSKPDVVFADPLGRVDAAVRTIEQHDPRESVREVLSRAVETILTTARDIDPEGGLLRQRLIATVPAVRARALHHALEAQDRFARALKASYPDVFDEVTAATVAGQLLGAILGALRASAARGSTVEEMVAAVRRAANLALAAYDAQFPPATGSGDQRASSRQDHRK